MNPLNHLKLPKIKVFVSAGGNDDCWWFPQPYEVVDKIHDANVVLLTGGSDVDPARYGHKPHPSTSSNIARDEKDFIAFQTARELKLPVIGICRGAQFLCVMAGGKLVQDQTNSLSRHALNTFIRQTIMVRSDHHQAQYPWQLEASSWDLLGWTDNIHNHHSVWVPHNGFRDLVANHGHFYSNNPVKGPHLPEVEDVYYRNINSLAIQSHPEWAHENEDHDVEMVTYYRSLVLRLLNGWDSAST